STQSCCVLFYLCKHQKGKLPVESYCCAPFLIRSTEECVTPCFGANTHEQNHHHLSVISAWNLPQSRVLPEVGGVPHWTLLDQQVTAKRPSGLVTFSAFCCQKVAVQLF